MCNARISFQNWQDSSLQKVVSGGQTGVDQAALRAALAGGLLIGGWCPPGRVSEVGRIPDYFPLSETPIERSEQAPEVPRSLRTEWNVRDSDATLVLRIANPTVIGPGTDFTIASTFYYKRPLLICDPINPKSSKKIRDWINALGIRTLNIAGPSEKMSPGIGDVTYKFLLAVFNV